MGDRCRFLTGPSAEARAWVDDPANRLEGPFDLSPLPAERAEARALAERDAPGFCERWGVALAWVKVAGREVLEVTPNEVSRNATLVYLFGGGFISGGPLEDLQIIGPLAAGTGMRVVAPVYRLSPEHPWPAGLDDAVAVTAAVARAGPYLLSGESAGGNLALCVVQTFEARGVPLPSALALLSPASDLSDGFDANSAPDDPTLNPVYVTQIPKVYAPRQDAADPAISPLFGTFGPKWPDTIITTGTRDRFLGQCARLERAIRAAGGHADLRVWDGLWHVFEYYPDVPEAAASLAEVSGFLKQRAKE